MNPHLQRGLLLVQQGRFELAEPELRQTVAEEPNEGMGHAILAICLVNQKKYREASSEAKMAIGLNPDEPFVFYANSLVLEKRKHYPEAQTAIEEAISLDPYNATYFGQLADLQFAQRRWRDALAAAEQGLQLDPEDVHCTNVRAMALVKLGQRSDAGQAIETALKRAPEDANSHANMGWTLIEQGQHEKAMEHFREALRLNPEMEWARIGILEAMKARYFLYRLMLGWFLWMAKLTKANQWVVIIGMYIGFRMLLSFHAQHPEWAVWTMPVIVLYVAFALMTWMSSSLFNLALRLNRFGRLALSREQLITSNWVGLCVLGALASVAFYFSTDNFAGVIGALAFVFLIPPVAHYYDCAEGAPRMWIILVIVGMGVIGFSSAAYPIFKDVAPLPIRALLAKATQLFVFAAIGTQFAVNYLVQMEPRH